MSKQNLFVILISLFAGFQLTAQNKPGQLLNVVPPSPNVAALGKYGEVPVSLYTGIPDISIPLYEIKDGSLDLPITLSYHAGGIRVEEIASSVGLGWALNAGGVLGRNVRGLPDEIGSWSSQPANKTVDSIMRKGSSQEQDQLATEVNRGLRDGEADLYYYNFNQYSGKFFYDQSGVVHTQSQKNLLINQVNGGWKVTAEDGTVYTFANVEQVSSSSCAPDQTVYSAWFLTNITSADAKRAISLVYDHANYTYETLVGQTKYFSANSTGANCLSSPGPCLGTQSYNTHRLARINFSGGYIKFIYNKVRCDLMTDKSLDAIEIYNSANELIKRFTLSYSYFGDNSDGCPIGKQNLQRLKLVSVTEEAVGFQKPPYIFEYNESVILPSRLSYAQDHWGYFNGKLNDDLIATFTTMVFPGQEVTFQGADRRTNPETAQAGILKKIKYPTGGESIFTYESNTVSDGYIERQTKEVGISLSANQLANTLPTPFESDLLVIPESGAQVRVNVSGLSNNLWLGCDIVHVYLVKDNNPIPFKEIDNGWDGITSSWAPGTYKLRFTSECSYSSVANFNITISAQVPTLETIDVRPVGGLRIRQVEDNPRNGSQAVIKTYKYHKENDTAHSSGVLVNFSDYGYDLGVQTIAVDEQGRTSASTYCSYRVRQSFTNYPLATTQGSYVGYGHVIVDFGESGESRYFYNAYSDLVAPSFPFAPIENFDWTRGFLLKSQDFVHNNSGLALVKETVNTPESFNQHRIYGIKTGSNFYDIYGGQMMPSRQPVPVYAFYPTITEFYALGQTKERLYDQNDTSKFIETLTEYTYSPDHLQVIQTRTLTSKSDQSTVEEIVSNKKYPADYTFTGAPLGSEALGIKNLQNLHVVNAVIEEYVVKQKRNILTNQVSNQRVIDGNIRTFKTDRPYPDKLFKLEIAAPISLSVYGNGSSLVGNTFLKHANPAINASFTPEVIFNSYDDKGNITSQQKANDIKKSYVWGYNAQYPVAKIVGTDIDDVITRLNLNPAVLQSSTISDEDMRTELNKIRTALPDAHVTTYTYKPLVGISSQTDINNRSMYYNYDSFGRLVLIRDKDKNIVKQFCYNYQGQQGNCVVNINNP